MPRYIEAVKSAEIISEKLNIPLGDLVDVFAEIPTADVEEVRQARWKGAGMGDYYCSLCLGTVSGNEYKFCPYCGAKMKEGE